MPKDTKKAAGEVAASAWQYPAKKLKELAAKSPLYNTLILCLLAVLIALGGLYLGDDNPLTDAFEQTRDEIVSPTVVINTDSVTVQPVQ